MRTTQIHVRLQFCCVFIILLLTSSAGQDFSPCPSILQYEYDGSIFLTIRPPPLTDSKIHLQVRMYTSSKHTVKDGEELVLQENKYALNKRLLSGSHIPIKYKTSFPSRVQAVLRDVILNHEIICQNNIKGSQEKKYEVSLAHTFFIEGEPKIPVSLDLGVECGRPEDTTSFIHRGDPTTPGQWPWHAALYWQEGASQSYKCGATLITHKAVVTAAHCVSDSRGEALDAKTVTVYLGKHRLSLWGDEVQAKEVRTIHVYPTYNSSSFHNDIAVLILRTPATFSVFVRPACVWGRQDDHLLEIIGKLGFVVGWGQNENGMLEDSLKLGRIEVVSVRECLSSYQPFTRFTTNRTFCAGFRNGTQNPCGGDSGGGMLFKPKDSEEWVLRGVVSTGASRMVDGIYTCDPQQYVIFTDVLPYAEWIVGLLST